MDVAARKKEKPNSIIDTIKTKRYLSDSLSPHNMVSLPEYISIHVGLKKGKNKEVLTG